MEFQFFCPRWGSENENWPDFCKKVKAAGYHGIEAGVPFDPMEKEIMKNALAENGLFLIGQYWQSFEMNFDDHHASFLLHLQNMVDVHPIKINVQTGKDYFTTLQNTQLFDTATTFSNTTAIEVVHETHRNKALFAAHVAKRYLDTIANLKITADFSHWCCVAESFLEDQLEAVQTAVAHTHHIHARVGHPQGPQVTDPRLPEWEAALLQHVQWWQQIVQHLKTKGEPVCTITTEFGPAPYMPHHPITKDPLASQMEINMWMMAYLKLTLQN
jgi:sugar phosphate isomerase/epimerase